MIEHNDSSAVRSDERLASAGVQGNEEEGGRWGGDPASVSGPRSGAARVADPEVTASPKRRRFSAAYKASIVEEAERCTEPGAIGALLRREGLYSSQLSNWRASYHAGGPGALHDAKRGRKATKHPLEDENAQLRKQNERLAHRLERAETIIEIQKKVATMLGIPLNSVENEEAN